MNGPNEPRTDFGYLKDGRYIPVPGAASRNEAIKHLRDNAIGGLHHLVQSKGFVKIEVISTTTFEEVDVDVSDPAERTDCGTTCQPLDVEPEPITAPEGDWP